MTWVAAAVIGGAAIGAIGSNMAASKQAGAAKDAASLQAQSAAQQTALQREMYDQTREDQTPWRDTGGAALNQLALRMGLESGLGVDREKFRTGENKRLVQATTENYDPRGYLEANPDVRKVLGNKVASSDPYDHLTRFGLGENRKTYVYDPIYNDAGYQAALDVAKQGQQGQAGFGDLSRDFTMADYEADPGYAFRQQQGQQQIDRQAAARGGLISGAALKATQRFGQDLASQEYGNAYNRFQSNQNNQFNRLASLAGVGQTANNALQQAGSQFANAMTGISANNAANQGNALMAAGNARASGYAGIGNALSGAVANWPQQQQQPAYQIPQGYQMGSGYAGNALATSQGYQPLNHAAANAGYYD